jgi:electron transport complex protein RnfD
LEETKAKEKAESPGEPGPRFLVSSSPHIHEGKQIRDIMRLVIIALIPATLFSIYLFGLRALLTIVIAVGSAVMFEAVWQKAVRKPVMVGNLSAALTGLLLALNLPSASPWWMICIGSLFAIVIAKQLYGGIGYNIFNPALVGRVVLLIAFPVHMTARWVAPSAWGMNAVTTATPLGKVREALMTNGHIDVHLTRQEVFDLLIGNRAGSSSQRRSSRGTFPSRSSRACGCSPGCFIS